MAPQENQGKNVAKKLFAIFRIILVDSKIEIFSVLSFDILLLSLGFIFTPKLNIRFIVSHKSVYCVGKCCHIHQKEVTSKIILE